MRKSLSFASALVLAVAGALALEAGQAPDQTPAASGPDTTALAVVNGAPITADEIDTAIGAPLRKLQEQIYRLRRQKLEAMITDRLLADEAARRGVTLPALLDAEVTRKVALVTEEQIAEYVAAGKLARAPEEDEATFNDRVRARLQSQKLAEQRARFLQALRSDARVAVNLTPPPITRVEIPIGEAPVRGAATAPVTIVEFSDFHCPFCKRVQPTLKQVLDRYAGQVRLVYRDFPLEQLHPQARKASEAARCAGDQGRFWEFHDGIYAGPTNASPATLRAAAAQAGLDVASFEQCVEAGTHRAAVQQDADEGRRLGVTGTPAFFVNGRLVSGAQPLEAFAAIIDEELSEAGRLPPAGVVK